MAGMFYSLQEAAEKLGKTEDQVRAIVQSGQLREFRDGPNLLFKVDEVDALIADSGVAASQGRPAPRTARPQSPAREAGRPGLQGPFQFFQWDRCSTARRRAA